MSRTVLHEDDRGRHVAEGNEYTIEDLTTGDPVARRMHSQNETVGKDSVCQYIESAWREIGLVTYEADERYRHAPERMKTMEVVFHTHIQGRGWDDPSPVDGKSDYRPFLRIRHDGPIYVDSDGHEVSLLGTQALTRVTRFYTDGGKFCFNFQDADGTPACVIYRVVGPDESQWEAVGTVPIQLF